MSRRSPSCSSVLMLVKACIWTEDGAEAKECWLGFRGLGLAALLLSQTSSHLNTSEQLCDICVSPQHAVAAPNDTKHGALDFKLPQPKHTLYCTIQFFGGPTRIHPTQIRIGRPQKKGLTKHGMLHGLSNIRQPFMRDALWHMSTETSMNDVSTVSLDKSLWLASTSYTDFTPCSKRSYLKTPLVHHGDFLWEYSCMHFGSEGRVQVLLTTQHLWAKLI